MSLLPRFHLRRTAVFALAIALAACTDRSGITSPAKLRPSADISDGAHGGGNGNVFFLPPLVSDPSKAPGYGDPFQPNLPVAFRICALTTANGCDVNPIVREFPPSAVTMSLTDQLYQANWDTKADNLDPTKNYRIEVRIGDKTLAWADVDVVSSGSQLRNVNTGEYIGLVDGRTLPIKVRIEQGWNCVNQLSCITQVVTNTPPAGQTYTVVTTNDGENAAAFPANWFDPTAAGTNQVVVTIEDVTSQLNPSGGTDGCGIGKTVMLTGGHCVRFTTNPRVTFTNTVIVAVCEIDALADTRQLLVKYDYNEDPVFLRNVQPPIVCPDNHTIGAARTGVMGQLASALSRVGRAVSRAFAPKTAYAIDLGVGGAIDAGGGFSLVAPGLPATMTAVAGDGQTGGPGGTLGVAPQVRLTTPHPTSAPLVGAQVVCTVTGGGGSLGGAASATVTTDATGLATCPLWTLGGTTGANSLHITAPKLDQVVRLGAMVEGTGTVLLRDGALTYGATATGGFQVAGTVFYSTTALNGIRVDLISGSDPQQPATQTTTTSGGGHYTFTGVATGAYTVKVYGSSGYLTWTGMLVNVSGNVTQDMYLPKNLALLSPANNAVLSATPTLTWAANPDAVSYRLQVNRTDTWELVAHPLVTTTSYTLDSPLVPLLPGTNYTWQVDAYDANNHPVGTSAGLYYWNFTTASVFVDGTMSPGEWTGASTYPVTLNVPGGGTVGGTLYIRNDATNMYFALSFSRSSVDQGDNLFGLEFNNADNGTVPANGDDYITYSFSPVNVFSDAYRSGGGLSVTTDNTNGGTNDGAGAFRNANGVSVYEMVHPLRSGDQYDFALTAGQTVGFHMGVIIGGASSGYPAGPISYVNYTLH